MNANYPFVGEYAKAASEWEQALTRAPTDGAAYENLADVYLALGRFDDARATVQAATAHNLDGGG